MLILFLLLSQLSFFSFFIGHVYADGEEYDYVDQTSNVDGVADIGTHSNFTAMQYGPDGIYDTLTEADTGPVVYPISNMNFTGDATGWSTTTAITQGTATYGYDSANGNPSPGSGAGSYYHKATSSASKAADITFTTETSFTYSAGTPSSVYLSYAYTLGGNSFGTGGSLIIRLVKPDGTTADLSTVTLPAAAVAWTYSRGITVNPTLFTQSGTYKLQVVNRLVAGAKGTSNYVQLNFDDIGLSIDTVNYELDLEVQWVNANYTRTNEYLCIYTGTLNSENLQVDVWDGTGWTTVITALTANAWNNVSVSDYLTSSTFTIRFKGTVETNDATQSSWQIDCALLHTWSAASYARTADQTLSISPSPSRQSAYNRAAFQPLQILLEASRLLSLTRIAGQLVNIILSTTRQTSYTRTTSQPLTFITETTLQKIIARYTSQTLTILTEASRSQSLSRVTGATVTTSFSTSRQTSYNRLTAQALTLIQVATRQLTQPRTANQPVAILTQAARFTSYRRASLTPLSIIADALRITSASRTANQLLTILLSTYRQATLTRTVDQPLTFITTSTLTKIAAVIQRYASQALTILTQTTRQQTLNRTVPQPLNILLSISRRAFYSRTAEVLLQINMQTAIRIIIYLPPAPSPAPAPMPMPSIQLDLIIQTAHITRLWWQKTTTVEVLVVNKGTVATDVTFEYTLLDSRNQTVTHGTQTVFISGLDKKTVYISIPTPPDGKYTIQFRTTQPVTVEAKSIVTVETPFYGQPEFTITIIFLIAFTFYIIKKRR
jgi:hypothetical protein